MEREPSVKPRLIGIQSLRGIAAFLVLFQHVTYYVFTSRNADFSGILAIDYGRMGVKMFFVISGFVMVGCMGEGRRFLWHRFLRIYPVFWLTIGVSFLLLRGISSLHWHFTWYSTTLLPATEGNGSYLIPYWTLLFEIVFYLVVACLALMPDGRRAALWLVPAWLAAIIWANVYLPFDAVQPGPYILLSRFNLYFIAGLVAGLYFPVLSRIPAFPLLVGALLLWPLGNALLATKVFSSDVLESVAFACVVLAAATWTVRHRILQWLGDVSFGVYLLHVPIAYAVIHALRKNDAISLGALWLIAFAVTVAGALLYGTLEHQIYVRLLKPLQRLGLGRKASAS